MQHIHSCKAAICLTVQQNFDFTLPSAQYPIIGYYLQPYECSARLDLVSLSQSDLLFAQEISHLRSNTLSTVINELGL